MKYCQKCGNQVMDEAIICPACGCAVAAEAYQMKRAATETPGLATCAVAFSFLSPIVGIILGIIGLSKYTTETYRRKCSSAIVIAIGVFIAAFSILMAVSMY